MAERERSIDRGMRGRSTTRDARVREWHIDGALVRQATRGPFTRQALLDDGVSPDAVDRRVKTGHLTVLYPGVYAIAGAPLTRHAHHLAATLACGPRAVLSSVNAAVGWAVIRSADTELHVTVPASSRRGPRGIAVHRADLARHEVRRKDGLLVTSPVRTLLDLAATHPHLLERAINEAYALRLVRPGELEPIRGRRGAKALRAALTDRPGFDRSKAERTLMRLIVRAGLPRPQTNVPIGPWEADLLWPDRRLVVETDGYASHSSRHAFESDRQKDADLQARGYRVVRFTWRQLTDHPERTVATLTALLLREEPLPIASPSMHR